jgi:hypothetical protein
LALSTKVMARPSATRSPPTIAFAVSSRSLRKACFALMACGVKRKRAEAQDGCEYSAEPRFQRRSTLTLLAKPKRSAITVTT